MRKEGKRGRKDSWDGEGEEASTNRGGERQRRGARKEGRRK